MTLCVLLWARQGREADVIAYEDRVLQLLPDHGGRLLQRARTAGEPGRPLEVQFVQFPSEAGLSSFMADERRAALASDRDAAIERSEVLRVDLV
ncbi:MAG: hypothetical protein ACRD07_18835 [Acidimicrobiales bacterium]